MTKAIAGESLSHVQAFILRSLASTPELSAAKLADRFHRGVASYAEILRMREQLDLMVEAGHLALSNEGKYRLTSSGREMPHE